MNHTNENMTPLTERRTRLAREINLLKVRYNFFGYGYTKEFIRGINGQNIAAGEPVFMTQPLDGTANIMVRVTPLTLGDSLFPVIIEGKLTDVSHLFTVDQGACSHSVDHASYYDTMIQALDKPETVTCEVRYSDAPSEVHTQEIQIGLGDFDHGYEVHNTVPSWAVLLEHLEDQTDPTIYDLEGTQILKVELPARLVEQYDETHLYAGWITETEAFVKSHVLYDNQHEDSGNAYGHLLGEGSWLAHDVSAKIKAFCDDGFATVLNSAVSHTLVDNDTSELWELIDAEVLDNHEMTRTDDVEPDEQAAKLFDADTMLELHEYDRQEIHISWENCFTGQLDYDYLNRATSIDIQVAIEVSESTTYLSDCMQSSGDIISTNASNWVASLEHTTLTEIIGRAMEELYANHDIENGDRLMGLGELVEIYRDNVDECRGLVLRQQTVFGSSMTFEDVLDQYQRSKSFLG